MPAHRKPFAVHAASGAVAHNPQRFRDRLPEPQPTAPLGTAPKHLTGDEKKAWREIATNAPPGTLYVSDRIAVEMAAKLLVRFRAGGLSKASEMGVLLSLLARLGMTPADRTKLAIEKPKDATPGQDEWSFVRRPSAELRAIDSERPAPGEQVDEARVQ